MTANNSYIDKFKGGFVIEVILLLLDVPHNILHGRDIWVQINLQLNGPVLHKK